LEFDFNLKEFCLYILIENLKTYKFDSTNGRSSSLKQWCSFGNTINIGSYKSNEV
jgi:hypothetical protein